MVQDAHASWLLQLAETVQPSFWSHQETPNIERLDREQDNLRAALRWLTESGDVGRSLRMGAALWEFWWIRSYFTEGKNQLDALLGIPGASKYPVALASVRHGAGILAFVVGQHQTARQHLERAVADWRNIGDAGQLGYALACLGMVARDHGDFDRAVPWLEEALILSRDVGDRRTIAFTLLQLGNAARDRGDFERGRRLLEECLALNRALGSSAWITAIVIQNLALAVEFLGDDTGAAALYRESLALSARIGDRGNLVLLLDRFAGLATRRGDYARALRLFGAATQLREEVGRPIPPLLRERNARLLEVARSNLSAVDAAAALAEGRATTWQQASADVLDGNAEGANPEDRRGYRPT
jgi:tetratricopeptide (TPR) repeat protein